MLGSEQEEGTLLEGAHPCHIVAVMEETVDAILDSKAKESFYYSEKELDDMMSHTNVRPTTAQAMNRDEGDPFFLELLNAPASN